MPHKRGGVSGVNLKEGSNLQGPPGKKARAQERKRMEEKERVQEQERARRVFHLEILGSILLEVASVFYVQLRNPMRNTPIPTIGAQKAIFNRGFPPACNVLHLMLTKEKKENADLGLIMLAAQQDHPLCARALLQSNNNVLRYVDSVDEKGFTALMYAAQKVCA